MQGPFWRRQRKGSLCLQVSISSQIWAISHYFPGKLGPTVLLHKALVLFNYCIIFEQNNYPETSMFDPDQWLIEFSSAHQVSRSQSPLLTNEYSRQSQLQSQLIPSRNASEGLPATRSPLPALESQQMTNFLAFNLGLLCNRSALKMRWNTVYEVWGTLRRSSKSIIFFCFPLHTSFP